MRGLDSCGRCGPRAARLLVVALQAAALAGVAILSSGATFAVMQTAHQDRTQTLFDAHMRAEDPGRMIEVASSDKHTVKPWLDARLDFAPPVDDLTAQGFPLIGGRLDYVDGRRAAVLVYGRRKHVIDVFLRPSGDASPPPASADRRGFHLIGWRHGGFDWWAVSDIDPAELKTLHDLQLLESSRTKRSGGFGSPRSCFVANFKSKDHTRTLTRLRCPFPDRSSLAFATGGAPDRSNTPGEPRPRPKWRRGTEAGTHGRAEVGHGGVAGGRARRCRPRRAAAG